MAELLKLEEREKLGQKLSNWVENTVDAVVAHKERCDRNEALYRLQPYDRAYKPFGDSSCTIAMPLMKSNLDSLVADITTSITKQAPYFSYQTYGQALGNRDVVEDCTQWWIRHSDFDRKMKLHALMTGLNGRAVYRVTFSANAKGFHADKPDSFTPQDKQMTVGGIDVGSCGILVDVIHIHDVVVYPTSVPEITRARFVGHRFYLYQYEIAEKCASGEYFEDAQYGLPSDTPAEKQVGRDTEWDGVDLNGSDDAEDELVECFTGIAKLDIEEKGEFKYYEVAFIQSTGKMLFIKPYAFERPWYFSPSFHYEYDKFYYAGSVAQDLQGLQLLKNELIGLSIDGILMAAFPSAFFDAKGGYTEDQFVTAMPGRLYPVNGAPNIMTVRGTFDPKFIPEMLGYIDAEAEGVARISRTSNMQGYQKGTTAREVAALQQAASVASNDYLLTYAGNELCDMVDMARTFMYENFDAIKEAWGDAFPATSADQLAPGGVFEVSGKTPTDTPEVRRQAAEALLQVKMATGTQRIDGDALIEGMVEDSGLQNADQIYISPEEEMAQMQMMGMGGMNGNDAGIAPDAGLAGMGSVPGVVP